MPFTVEKLPNEPIVVVVRAGTSASDELAEAINVAEKVLDAQPEKVFMVLDIRNLSMGIDDLTRAASAGARGPSAIMHHPKILENLVVSDKTLVRLAMQGLSSATFGNVKVRVFETPELALAYSRGQIKSTADDASTEARAG